MKEEKRSKTVMFGIAAMVLTILGAGVAFAALSATLTFNGVAEVSPASWSVKFSGLSSATKTGTATVINEPVLSNTSITGMDIVLVKPGDSVKYTFYVENAGTLDAKIDTYNAPTGPTCVPAGTNNGVTDATKVCGNLTYTIKYLDTGNTFAVGDQLLAGSSNKRQVELTIAFTGDASNLPDDKVAISNLNFSIHYNEL